MSLFALPAVPTMDSFLPMEDVFVNLIIFNLRQAAHKYAAMDTYSSSHAMMAT